MNKIICLCGPTRFKTEFFDAAEYFTLKGYIVLMPGVFSHADGIVLDDHLKRKLDILHKAKIELSSGIYVVNVGGYIGDSTRSEIEYAERLNKGVSYFEDPKHGN